MIGLTHTKVFQVISPVAIVDAATLEILRVEAAPRIYAQVLEYKRDKYRRSFKFSFFGIPIRFRRAPRVQVLEIEFGNVPLEKDLSDDSETEAIVGRFPDRIVWQEYKVNFGGDLVQKEFEERVQALGHQYYVIDSFEAFVQKINSISG